MGLWLLRKFVTLGLLLVMAGGFFLWTQFRSTFLHQIDATATLGFASPVEGTRYTARVRVHMGHPANVTCTVHAISTEGTVVGSDVFTLYQADGEVSQTGFLDVYQEVQANKALNIECHEY